MSRALLIVLDGVGVGNARDAAAYGDAGANTLRHVLREARPRLPNFEKLGLLSIEGVCERAGRPAHPMRGAYYGRMQPRGAGKDTTTGHWEIAGLTLATPFPTYPAGFPPGLIAEYEAQIGIGVLGNCVASGTQIIERLGERHMRTRMPIVYTSADSVFQIAAHESLWPPEKLYELCRVARELLTGEHAVGRVIARPFVGEPGRFTRTGNRRDFSLKPPGETLLTRLQSAGFQTFGIGKIEDIFAHQGLGASDHASGNEACMRAALTHFSQMRNGLMFVNLVDFDMLYGHRRDARGFALALEQVDRWLPQAMDALENTDLMLFCADHGCDPTFPGTDHTRECVPLLAYSPKFTEHGSVFTRNGFADIGATLLAYFGLETGEGVSFLDQLR